VDLLYLSNPDGFTGLKALLSTASTTGVYMNAGHKRPTRAGSPASEEPPLNWRLPMRASLVLKRTTPLLSRLAARVASAMAEYRREMQLQRSIRHLRDLPDYLLQDMALDRSEIVSVVRRGSRNPSRRPLT